MLDVSEFYEDLRYLIDEFDESHNYLWQAGFNGRSGGYLVLYQGFAKPSEYKSYCRNCGQKNYESITENGNKCGRCGAEERVDFIKPPIQTSPFYMISQKVSLCLPRDPVSRPCPHRSPHTSCISSRHRAVRTACRIPGTSCDLTTCTFPV